MEKRKHIKVKYSKLGRDGVWGYAHPHEHTIEVDSRLKGKKLLEILLHESTHITLPKASESQVERISIALTNMLWKQGYRKIDNDNSEPLQDGKR